MAVQKEALQASPMLLEVDQVVKMEVRNQESLEKGQKKEKEVVAQREVV